MDGTCEACCICASSEKVGMSLPQVWVGPLQCEVGRSPQSPSMFAPDHFSRLPGSAPSFVTSSSVDDPKCGAVAMGALASLNITKVRCSNFFPLLFSLKV